MQGGQAYLRPQEAAPAPRTAEAAADPFLFLTHLPPGPTTVELNEQWEVLFYEDYKWHAKPFPVKKFGLERAKREAEAFCAEKEKEGRLGSRTLVAGGEGDEDEVPEDPRLSVPARRAFATHDFAAGAHPQYNRPVPRYAASPRSEPLAENCAGKVGNSSLAKPVDGFVCGYSDALKKYSGTFAANRRDEKLARRRAAGGDGDETEGSSAASRSRCREQRRAAFASGEMHSEENVPVEFDARMQGWTVMYYDEHGRPRTKCYSARKWGNQVARDKALALYQEMGLGM